MTRIAYGPVTHDGDVNSALYVGTMEDFSGAKAHGFSILGACKDPLHRTYARMKGAPYDGYLTKSMPVDEPEYLYAEREHALYCNLIDAPDSKYISPIIIERALKFIDDELEDGRDVLVVCNHAKSRSPSISLMWLIKTGQITKDNMLDGESILDTFRRLYYPAYAPNKGFADYVEKFWKESLKDG